LGSSDVGFEQTKQRAKYPEKIVIDILFKKGEPGIDCGGTMGAFKHRWPVGVECVCDALKIVKITG